ncbi:MAG: thioredoxin family protein [Coleofasciculaceae cyanobacterium RL_1_1]|nr:thioredoxin family protein [Coleofasciculaceae cyanobacterium RL_1_1]
MMSSVNEHDFRQLLLTSHSPILVNFWAPWCGICRQIHPLLERFEAQSAGRICLVDINADASLQLASEYRLSALPTLLLIDNSIVVRRWEGFQGREALTRALTEVAVQYGQIAAMVP